MPEEEPSEFSVIESIYLYEDKETDLTKACVVTLNVEGKHYHFTDFEIWEDEGYLIMKRKL